MGGFVLVTTLKSVKLREDSLRALVHGGSGGVTEWVHQTPDLQSADTTPYKHKLCPAALANVQLQLS